MRASVPGRLIKHQPLDLPVLAAFNHHREHLLDILRQKPPALARRRRHRLVIHTRQRNIDPALRPGPRRGRLGVKAGLPELDPPRLIQLAGRFFLLLLHLQAVVQAEKILALKLFDPLLRRLRLRKRHPVAAPAHVILKRIQSLLVIADGVEDLSRRHLHLIPSPHRLVVILFRNAELAGRPIARALIFLRARQQPLLKKRLHPLRADIAARQIRALKNTLRMFTAHPREPLKKLRRQHPVLKRIQRAVQAPRLQSLQLAPRQLQLILPAINAAHRAEGGNQRERIKRRGKSIRQLRRHVAQRARIVTTEQGMLLHLVYRDRHQILHHLRHTLKNDVRTPILYAHAGDLYRRRQLRQPPRDAGRDRPKRRLRHRALRQPHKRPPRRLPLQQLQSAIHEPHRHAAQPDLEIRQMIALLVRQHPALHQIKPALRLSRLHNNTGLRPQPPAESGRQSAAQHHRSRRCAAGGKQPSAQRRPICAKRRARGRHQPRRPRAASLLP